jgi:hypothetical protein
MYASIPLELTVVGGFAGRLGVDLIAMVLEFTCFFVDASPRAEEMREAAGAET